MITFGLIMLYILANLGVMRYREEFLEKARLAMELSERESTETAAVERVEPAY